MTNKRRKSDAARWANQTIRRRTVLLMGLLGVAVFAALLFKLYDLQIVRHEELQEKAVAQQTRSAVVTASRGAIYDKNGEIMAVSATAETVCISPYDIENHKDTQDKEYVARGLARILELDESAVLEKMGKTNLQYVELKRKVEQDTADEVRRFINGEIDAEGNPLTTVNADGKTVLLSDPTKTPARLHGIFLNADSKRYYPYGTLASQVIGFVGSENTGLYGLEAKYDGVLEGTEGLTVTAKTNTGEDMLYQYEQYYDAENGDSLMLTLDVSVQSCLEKGIESMVDKFGAKHGGAGIVMDVNTGGILAMASYPTFDLNDPFTIYDKNLSAQTDAALAKALAGLTEGSEEYAAARSKTVNAALGEQWRNRCISDTYEPGSTFKPITLAAALEEGLVNLSSTFNCTGSITVPGWPKAINCSNHAGHGLQNLMEATGHSCNPAFISMGLKIGTQKYYQYLKSFGLMEKTGVDEISETVGMFAGEKDFNSNVVSLASYAFGQTFTVTPLQVIRAQAATINGGYLRTPYLVEQVVDAQGAVKYQHDSTPVRQVVSEETSATVRQCLEYVVASGTGKNGQVAGYRIGGKTGTADKTGNPDREVVVSFMCFAPADDPQIIMLITMDTPSRNTGVYVSGGNMVAPTASAVMGEILPYVGVEPEYTAEEMVGADVTVPNVVGMTAEAAREKITGMGFTCRTVGEGETVTDQTPLGGAIVPNSAAIILYLGEEKPDAPCTVPNVVGMTAAQANTALTNAGLIMRVSGATAASSGNVYALNQSAAPGAEVPAGTVVTVQLGAQGKTAD
ncbi:penicillin-binding transpeptidase domain-containing protein [uncultured Oscillibacter sp.]|uniref:penicillin-binding transpeptidase domain-containing protein n=1 Tax=uncultured Oscillibacter sp. TaxID=876091 RepID=UPI0025CDC878|nr:penicillin-binding transpeptidase domain-containing protein [uncultured Oscillibacter sp.]